jgi:hypothetical protein
VSVPDPLGRDRLATGAAVYKPPVYGEKPPPKPLLRRWPVMALLVVLALLVVGTVVHKLTSGPKDSPASAATSVISLFLAEDYGKMRSKLCREDRGQVGDNDLESAGREGAALLRTLDKPVVDSVADVALPGAYAGVTAKQVQGHITATVGAGTGFKVVTVKEGGNWRVCLSPGGYGLSAFDLDVPLGGELDTIG